jgi:hypothetical protein
VRGEDSPREGGLPATGTQDLETAQSEGDVVATQLDDLDREQEENEGSSMEESGPSSEGIAARDARYLFEAIGSRVGNGYGCKGRSTSRSQAKLELHWQVVRAIRQLAWAKRSSDCRGSFGYHTTVTPWIVGDKEEREILGLTKEDSEQVLVLRDCILRHCFRELDTIDESGRTRCPVH